MEYKFNTRLTTTLLAAGLITASCILAEAAESQTKPELPPASTKQNVTFVKDIKPLFDASCVRCHGQDRPKAKLRLDSLEGVLAGSEDGKVVITGDSAKSSLVKAIARINPETAMPPEKRQRGGGPRNPGAPQPGGANKSGGQEKQMVPNATAAHPASGAEKTDSQNNAERPEGGSTQRGGQPGGPGGRGPRGNQGPPPKPLTAEEVGLVRAWIDQGAK